MTRNDLINAAQIIKDNCNDSDEHCIDSNGEICPFYSFSFGCTLNKIPGYWQNDQEELA